jgi:hypothetical protein
VLKITDKAYTNSWFVIFNGCANIEAYFIKYWQVIAPRPSKSIDKF